MANDVGRCEAAFLKAASSGDLALIKRLGKKLQKPEDVVNEEGQTALHLAAAAGSTDICSELIKAFKIDVNAIDNLGNTPLIISILEKRTSVAKYLIENGAGIMMRDARAYTPLHCAATKGNEEIAKLLISKGAAVDTISEGGTPLQCAALAGKKGTLKILLDNKANPNTATPLLYTPLMLSISANSFDCFQLLIKAGADPNLASCTKTPLIVAACEGKTKIIKCLLKLEADPNATDAVGVTALEHAAMRGQVEAVVILFQVTSPLSFFPDWSVMGIMKHVSSEEAREQRDNRRKEFLETAKSKGRDAFKRKDYTDAIFWYTEANLADPTDASVLSNRSLCWARLNQGKQALSDAEMCVELDPKSAKAHYREGAAWMLLEEYSYASEAYSEALKFDPTNEEIKKAHREAVQAEFGVEVSENMRVVHL